MPVRWKRRKKWRGTDRTLTVGYWLRAVRRIRQRMKYTNDLLILGPEAMKLLEKFRERRDA